ncbi:ProQ/FINO family protein [Caballeronia sp. GACF4]|uniref:ProQ/FINO family protein n=1 Tax=Caballeronia sp. GACF4 TaxID=2921763 RepID=UPI0032EBAC4E
MLHARRYRRWPLCRGQRYWTCVVEGNVHVNLNGAITGVVTVAEAQNGGCQENKRLARRREQIAKSRDGRLR